MKYQLIGRKILHQGKTLWEIVGNLKNFGVGRLVLKSNYTLYSEPSFFKILQVQPIPPPKKQFTDRGVIVWIEEVFRGIQHPIKRVKKYNEMPKFQLIPKSEEEKYLTAAKEFAENFSKKIIPQYVTCPPLYKILWETEFKRKNKICKEMPSINVVICEKSMYKVKLSEKKESFPLATTNLHKRDVPVEKMIEKMVFLKELTESNSMQSQNN